MKTPAQYLDALRGRLTGISDRSLENHLRLLAAYQDEASAIEHEFRRVDWTRPTSSGPTMEVKRILKVPISELDLPEDFTGSPMQDDLGQLQSDLEERGITFWPKFYWGDQDFWTTDRATSINVPWFLGKFRLWDVVNARTARFTHEEIRQIIRHETGHAINYAFRLYWAPEWKVLFGDFEQPYDDGFQPDPESEDYVQYLDRAGMKHYAQKHPDEDWAETFATWLDDPAWHRYTGKALAKLEYVDRLAAAGAFGGPAPVQEIGERNPYQEISGTVGDYVGIEPAPGTGGWSPMSALLRREPRVLNAIELHRLYFENLGPGEQPSDEFRRDVQRIWGAWESWLLELRAIGASSDGWALTVWDDRAKRLRNVLTEEHDPGLAGARVMLAIDLHEHAYYLDTPRKELYLGAVFRNLNWDEINARHAAAQGGDR